MLERDETINIGRRQFIKGLLVGSGTILAAGSVLDGYLNVEKHAQIYKDAARKVEAQGIPQADQEALHTATQMRSREYKLNSRSLDEIVTDVQQVRAAEAQQGVFRAAVDQVVNEQRDHLPTAKRYIPDATGITVGAMTAFGATVFLLNPNTVEAPRQNEVTLEEKI